MPIIQTRKIWLGISATLVGLSLLSLFVWGLNFGIDFTGGSLLETEFSPARPAPAEVRKALAPLGLHSLLVQPEGEKRMILRFQETDEDTHQKVLTALKDLVKQDKNLAAGEKSNEVLVSTSTSQSASTSQSTATSTASVAASVEELRFDAVGPSIGRELKSKSVYAIFFVLVAIILYVAWAFRQVSKPVSSWKYGVAAVIALFHDVIITMGAFSVLGHFYGTEVNTPFVAAILTVLGYSVNDSIVVFDRIRENLPRSDKDFEGTVNDSINQTLQRSINTSATTLVVLLSILFFGGASIRNFVLALSIGVFVGTYSSIFVASPILVVWERLKNKNR